MVALDVDVWTTSTVREPWKVPMVHEMGILKLIEQDGIRAGS